MPASKLGLDGEIGVQPVCVDTAEDDLVHRVPVDRLLECLAQRRARRQRRADVRVRQVADAVLFPTLITIPASRARPFG